jgi:hypothetical protein
MVLGTTSSPDGAVMVMFAFDSVRKKFMLLNSTVGGGTVPDEPPSTTVPDISIGMGSLRLSSVKFESLILYSAKCCSANKFIFCICRNIQKFSRWLSAI